MSFKRVRNIGLAAIVAGSMIINGCNRPVEPISKFKDDVVLVACENDLEYNGVIQTLREKNAMRSRESRFSFTQRDKYTKVSVPNTNNDGLKITYIHVVKKDDLDDVLPEMKENGINYDIIQLRGHTNDMSGLHSLTKKYSSKNSILFLGGCNSYNLAEKLERANRATIGGSGMQEASRNTHYLLNIINFIGTDKADNWPELKQELQKSDSRFDHYVSR